MKHLAAILAIGICAAASAQEIEVVRPVLQPKPISAIASDGVDAIALWDSTLVTRITNDGRSLTPTGIRIAPRTVEGTAIVYGNGEYVVAVSDLGFGAVFLDRNANVIRRVHLSDDVYFQVVAAAANGVFLLAVNDKAFVVDAAGNVIAPVKLPQTARAAASDGTRFLVAGDRKAMLIDATGTIVAVNDYTPADYDPSGVAVGFDGTNYVVAWTDRTQNLAQRMDRGGAPAGDPVTLRDGVYTTLQAISEDGAVVVAMSGTSVPFAVARITGGGVTTALPPLDYGNVLAPIGTGFIAAKTTSTFLTHDFAIDGSRPNGNVVAQSAESLRLAAAATNGTSVLAVWERTGFNGGLYAAVVGPNGVTAPVLLPNARHVAAASNGKDFVVVYATTWYDGVYAAAIHGDGTMTAPAAFWALGYRHDAYAGVQWAGDAYLVSFVDTLVDYGGTSHAYRQLVSAAGTLIGTPLADGPNLQFACGLRTCFSAVFDGFDVSGSLFDSHGTFLREFPIWPQRFAGPTRATPVFDGAAYRTFWTEFSTASSTVFSTTVTESGTVGGAVLTLPATADATFIATRNGVFGAWTAASNEIDTVFIDRNDVLLPGPRVGTSGAVVNVLATTSWLGDSVLYARWTEDTAHGSAVRIFLRPVAPAHGHAARR